jgi:hypothetical protein
MIKQHDDLIIDLKQDVHLLYMLNDSIITELEASRKELRELRQAVFGGINEAYAKSEEARFEDNLKRLEAHLALTCGCADCSASTNFNEGE